MCSEPSPRRGDALLLVDIQRDFLPGGALPVPGADAILPPVNQLVELFTDRSLPIVASRDWHPRDHCSFREQGGPWPVHCVAETSGAEFPDELHLPAVTRIVSKATDTGPDSFSAFDRTDLAEWLRENGVSRVYVAGLATEYCVAATVRDATAAGLDVFVVLDAVGAIDRSAGDGERALAELKTLGAGFRTAAEILPSTASSRPPDDSEAPR